MGLDIYADDLNAGEDYSAHWSYGGFNRFRERLAVHEGFFLDDMEGFGGSVIWDLVTTDLKPLLDHSDCDGELTPQEAAQIWPRLETILNDWESAGNSLYDYDLSSGQNLVELLRYCSEHNVQAVFR